MIERLRKQTFEIPEEIKSILEELPLEQCSPDKPPAIRKQEGLCWHAPEGHVFRITGQFSIWQESNDPIRFAPPTLSKELFIEKNREDYEEYLEETGDPEEAMEWLLHDNDYQSYAPEFFEGEWLRLSADGNQASLSVVNRMSADFDRPYFRVITNLPGVDCLIFDSPLVEVFWWWDYTEPVLGSCQIKLVKSCAKKKEDLRIDFPEPVEQKIETPRGLSPLSEVLGTEDERDEILRHQRKLGLSATDGSLLPDFYAPRPRVLPPKREEYRIFTTELDVDEVVKREKKAKAKKQASFFGDPNDF